MTTPADTRFSFFFHRTDMQPRQIAQAVERGGVSTAELAGAHAVLDDIEHQCRDRANSMDERFLRTQLANAKAEMDTALAQRRPVPECEPLIARVESLQWCVDNLSRVRAAVSACDAFYAAQGPDATARVDRQEALEHLEAQVRNMFGL